MRRFLTRLVSRNRVEPVIVDHQLELAPPTGPPVLQSQHHHHHDHHPLNVGLVTSFCLSLIVLFFLTFQPNEAGEERRGEAATQSQFSLVCG